MIGNREISERLRRAYWEDFQRRKADLPRSVVRLIQRIEAANSNTNVGFRRRNLPALLARYFFDMRDVFSSLTKLLRPGAHAFIVVGNNHTVAGGERIEISTATFMSEIGESVGLEWVHQLGMEMLVSRDIFRSNACPSETILQFRRA